MYEVVFSQGALRQLEKLEKAAQKRIISALERIRLRPESYVSKLVGDAGCKFRVGDFRIILDIDKGALLILVIKVGHRRNVYR